MAEQPGLQHQLLKHVLRSSGGISAGELLFDPVTALPGLSLFVRQVEARHWLSRGAFPYCWLAQMQSSPVGQSLSTRQWSIAHCPARQAIGG